MQIYSRYSLVESGAMASDTAVLLEGSWPDYVSAERHFSLDDSIDINHLKIDERASDLAARVAAESPEHFISPDRRTEISLPWLSALRLRYHVLKLLRIEAFFQHVRTLRGQQHVRLNAQSGRDEDYATTLTALCRAVGAHLEITWKPATRTRSAIPRQSAAPWRNWLARLPRLWPCQTSSAQLTIAFCGNRSILDPVCQALVGRGCRAAWIYEQFAAKCWLRWRQYNVQQWLCDGSSGDGWHLARGRTEDSDAKFNQPMSDWIRQVANQQGQIYGRWLARLDEHFAQQNPAALVLDEDATPLARAAVAIAKRHGVPSVVVQHGAPYGRFGFAPLAADRLLAWGNTSLEQFVKFGIHASRIDVVGSPRHDPQSAPLPRKTGKRPRVLFLATNPPSDDRPDLIAFQCTTRSHREALRRLCRGVQRIDHAELVIKLHPRCRQQQVFRQVVAEFPRLRARIVQGRSVAHWFRQCDLAVSCGSSAGIEAAQQGKPVIELLDPGSAELLPAAAWGLWGVARDEEALHHLLTTALAAAPIATFAWREQVFAQLGTASHAAADAVLRAVVDPDRLPIGKALTGVVLQQPQVLDSDGPKPSRRLS